MRPSMPLSAFVTKDRLKVLSSVAISLPISNGPINLILFRSRLSECFILSTARLKSVKFWMIDSSSLNHPLHVRWLHQKLRLSIFVYLK